MQVRVYGVIGVLCAVVAGTPIGTNLGLVHLLWMLVSGRLLETRGAVIPGLTATGLPEPAVRRAWAALGQGSWSSPELLAGWRAHVEQAGVWRAHEEEGDRPGAGDVARVLGAPLPGCATHHYPRPARQAPPGGPGGGVAPVRRGRA